MPSSLAMNLSSASVFSTRPRVSVSGTGGLHLVLRGFSREPDYRRYPIARGLSVLSGSARLGAFDSLPYTYPLQRTIPSVRGRFTSPSPRRSGASDGMLTVSSIGSSLRMPLRSRLTLIRLALIRKPWSSGVGVSRPHYRYLYLHLLLRALQPGSIPIFVARAMLPYQPRLARGFHVFGTGLMPDYYPRGTARLVSCYALFK